MEFEQINELAGWVNQQRALELLGASPASKGWLHALVGGGKIEARQWDKRTLLYRKRDIEQYSQAKRRGRPPKNA